MDEHDAFIDFEKVVTGQETRTTIMIRNIPNKVSASLLLGVLNTCALGVIDFLFMPIDMNSPQGNNLGYAFVNLMYPRVVLQIINHMDGLYWPFGNSFKKCEICYSRIQGLDNLIALFKDSGQSITYPLYLSSELQQHFHNRSNTTMANSHCKPELSVSLIKHGTMENSPYTLSCPPSIQMPVLLVPTLRKMTMNDLLNQFEK